MSKNNLLLSILVLWMGNMLFSQGVGIGEWRFHTPLNKLNHIAGGDGKIYGASSSGILYFDKEDNSLNRLSKVEGLTGADISDIVYDEGNKTLVVAYENTNIDLIKDNVIVNIPAIFHSNLPPDQKKINSLKIIDGMTYVSCGFGVVLLDVDKEEIYDTYYLGDIDNRVNVYDIAATDTAFFAATDIGLFYGMRNGAPLSYYQNWHKYEAIPESDSLFNIIDIFHNMIFVNKPSSTDFDDWKNDTVIYYADNQWNVNSGELYFGDIFGFIPLGEDEFCLGSGGHFIVYDNDMNIVSDAFAWDGDHYSYPKDVYYNGNEIWIADNNYGIIKFNGNYHSEIFQTNVPDRKEVFQMSSAGNTVVSVAGGMNASWISLYHNLRMNVFSGEQWNNYSKKDFPEWENGRDLVSVAVNPQNENDIWVGTWNQGMYEFDNSSKKLVAHYTEENSSLQSFVSGNYSVLKVGGICFDKDNQLWVSNASAEKPVSVRHLNGEWESFSLGTLGSSMEIGRIMADSYGQKWIISRNAETLFAFDERQNPGNQVRTLTSSEGNGNLPGSVFAVAEDKDGELWLGTDHGIAVIYSPENVFTNNNYDAQPILIPRADNDSLADILLENNTITSIAVDGANNKWLGTAGAGVFKVSKDGLEEIFHFTAENSPLLSNTIMDITINETTGEVFFGTDKGIVSYKSTATEGEPTMEKVLVYPNPVRPGYTGPIAIRGLTANAFFKITDVAGDLVYEGQADGGQAIWYGKNMEGVRVRSGVYLVFSSNEDGSETNVAKILFVN